MLTGNQIRKKFLDYFARHGHTIVPSSSLVPHNDPTLLFTNAGMNQFKDCFLGAEKRDYVRATSSQKCVRAGGKHNDLENVGRTARHHTFFEMLGNFSFGDYFKKEAIAFAWQFLTEELGIDKERLYVSVYTDDDEAADIWHRQEGVPIERIFRFGEKDNFWAMGDTGPCGPCSEIFYDNGPEAGCGNPDCTVGCDCDRYMEIWNNVFMQFDRQPDGTLVPLPKPAVDTGMGLERITTVMQGVLSNYDTDLLRDIIRHIEQLSGKTYGDNAENDVSMRVMADHSRATAFLIADGVLPSNEGRGYVLRRIMRRAMRHARMLGFEDPVLFRTATFVLDFMAEAYPTEASRKDFVAKVVQNEEERFIQTLGNGLRILQDEVASLREQGASIIPGETVFRLYDTYGFPVDLTADIVEKEGFTLDEEGFEACMEEQRTKAREHWKGSGEEAVALIYKQLADRGMRSEFTGYDRLEDRGEVLALIRQNREVDEAACGETVEVICSVTPCYGESGGQVGDTGRIRAPEGELRIIDTRKPLPNLHVHVCEVVTGAIRKGESVDIAVDGDRRQAIVRNHTATHLLQAALQKVLGDHVKQAGSLVEPDRLRFDFTHFSPLSEEEIRRVEDEVNRQILGNTKVQARLMSADDALAAGAMALFGEKYGDIVRVVNVGDYSMELCGGTHADASGDIGLFRIVSEGGIAAGVRRIEAVTGTGALDWVRQQEKTLQQAAALVKSDPQNLDVRLRKLLEQQKELEKEVETLRRRLQAGQADSLLQQAVEVEGVRLLATEVDGMDGKQLRELADRLRDKLGSGVLALGCKTGDKVNLLVAVTKDLTARLHAGKLVAELAKAVGGRGGGRPDLAQAGGSQPEKLAETLAGAADLIRAQLAG
ncbi:alanyl-tRNA synthetase [Geothermobacter ehrlichii]|uniref:Alanine--tRNA ligase n=1 Tax=Geothermobacter ehrlichii TaxID=213224 RepID=A0A5D3WI94_9BACT|nr:alanine--tRNA ligase [Geothermobacter ehrlichii]TYO97493.1 alanyl-tRNA synthetase [Geothermobacter ehrlichii]